MVQDKEISREESKECGPENNLTITNTLFIEHTRRLCTWSSPDGNTWNQTDYTLKQQNGRRKRMLYP